MSANNIATVAFDPEGMDYDYETATVSGGEPDVEGHWGSLDPRTGMVLKGKQHSTWDLMIKEEERRGNRIIKKRGRYYSVPKIKTNVWDKAATLEVEENVGGSIWDKAGDPIQEKIQLHRNLTDALLDNKHIESFLAAKLPNTPLGYEPVPEDKERLSSVIEQQEKPQEFRDKLAVSLYLANSYDMEFSDIYNRYDAVSKEIWGKITPSAALEKILQADRNAFGLNRTIDYKGFGEATKHAYNQAGVGMVAEVAGLSRAIGELRSGWSASEVEWAENLAEWGDMMYKGVEQYYREHPEEFIQARGDGFWDTTFEYLSHPVAIYQGVLQSTPLILEGVAGGMVAGGITAGLGAGVRTTKFASWLGRTQGMAAPITGRKYAELRANDIEPSIALPQAFLTGQVEAIIEEWTLGKKLAIFKGAGSGAKKAIVGRVLATIIGGSKAYGRGVLEEGSQQFSENFWTWVFSDRDQKWMQNVMSQAAAGGPMEAVMAGGFAVAGKGYAALQDRGQVSPEEKLRRIEAVREIMLQAELTPKEANEINAAIDDVKTKTEAEIVAVKEAEPTPVVEAIKEKPEPQNTVEEIDQTEPEEATKDIQPPDIATMGGIAEERLTPNLYIGNVTRRMKKKFAKIWERQAEEVKGFTEEGFPTKRAPIEMTRAEATAYLNWLVDDLDSRLKNNKINTENDLAQANADWGDITALRAALGFSKGARPFKVIRAEKHKMVVIKNTQSRIWAAIKGVKETVTIRQALQAVMKGMSKAARKGFMEGARQQLALHKNLNKYAREQLKGLDMKKSQWSKLMTAIANAKNESEKIAAHALIDILAEQSRQAKAIKRLRKTVAYINRKVGAVMQRGGIREEFYNKIKALTDTFLIKPNTPKQQRAVRSLKIHLENLQKNTSNRYESQYETEIIPDSLIKRLDKINAVPIQEMKADAIENLNDTLQLLVHLNNTKNRLIKDRIARNLERVLNGAVEDLERVNDISPDESKYPATEQEINKYGALHSFIDIVAGAKNHDIETLVDTLSGGQMSWAYEIFVEGIAEGREKTFDYSNRIRNEFKATMASASIEFKDLQGMSNAFLRILKGKRGMTMRRFLGEIFETELTPKLYTIKITGKDQQFTMSELMMIYMHAQADFNLRALVDQGAATWKKRLGKMAPDEIEVAASLVEKDPKAKAMVDMATKVYANIAKNEINATSVSLIGIALAKEDNYAHVERYKTGGVAGAHRYRLNDLEREGRLQPRTGSKEPIIIRDFFEVFFNDIQTISQYVGMAEPLRNARNLINYRAYRNGLRDKGYAEQLSLLDEMLRNVQSLPEGGDAIDAVASFLMRGTVRAVLAEPGIFLGQYTSVNGIFNETERKYAAALKVAATAKDKQRYKNHSPSIKNRFELGVSSKTLSYLAQNDAVLRAFTGKTEFLSMFVSLIHKVDTLAITDICRVIEAEMADANRQGKAKDYWEGRGTNPSQLEFESKEYWDAWRKRTNYLIRRTQPMFTPESQSVFTSNKSAAKKMWFLFRSYVDQPLRMAQRSITAYKHGKISSGQLTADLANIWGTLALYAVVRFAVAAALFRRDDDWKDLLLDITLAPIRMLALVGFPVQLIIEQSFEATRAPEIGTVPTQFANNVAESLTWLSKGIGHLLTGDLYKAGPNRGKPKGPIEIERGLVLLLENALMFYGIPEDVPRRMYKGWTKKEKRIEYTVF